MSAFCTLATEPAETFVESPPPQPATISPRAAATARRLAILRLVMEKAPLSTRVPR